ncbi:MAG: hypothetical protein ACRC1T_04610 [Clostridium chrysemydis]|uniref:hypothetical protein n=1 Tax=Clostridium chrysemydis TaxID=2665504 RepID=UPI003F366880
MDLITKLVSGIYLLGSFIGGILLLISFRSKFKNLSRFQKISIALTSGSTIGILIIFIILAIINFCFM